MRSPLLCNHESVFVRGQLRPETVHRAQGEGAGSRVGIFEFDVLILVMMIGVREHVVVLLMMAGVRLRPVDGRPFICCRPVDVVSVRHYSGCNFHMSLVSFRG